jgi:DeoR family glycerol-3-phosphate regulon repressor
MVQFNNRVEGMSEAMSMLVGAGMTQGLGRHDRSTAILACVRAAGCQSIDALAERFAVTPQTIRRDVNRLCNRGLLRRRHGSVDLPPSEENLAYSARRILNLDAKRRIAAEVARHVPNGASLFFGIGTTPEQCARALVDHGGLSVMTNNLHVAMVFSRHPDINITIAGGRMRNLDGDVIAGEAHDFFGRYSVDIGIFGVASVDADGGLLDFDPDEVRMRRELSANCRRRFLVLDHSKFGRRALIKGGHIIDADMVFTDQPVPAAIERQLLDCGVQLMICGDAVSQSLLNDSSRP